MDSTMIKAIITKITSFLDFSIGLYQGSHSSDIPAKFEHVIKESNYFGSLIIVRNSSSTLCGHGGEDDSSSKKNASIIRCVLLSLFGSVFSILPTSICIICLLYCAYSKKKEAIITLARSKCSLFHFSHARAFCFSSHLSSTNRNRITVDVRILFTFLSTQHSLCGSCSLLFGQVSQFFPWCVFSVCSNFSFQLVHQ